MGLTGTYGATVDRQEGIRVIRAAVDRGVTLVDTAEAYGPFTNEELVGDALVPVRDQVVIATKFGFGIHADGTRYGLDSRPEHIRQVTDAMRTRLRVEAIMKGEVQPRHDGQQYFDGYWEGDRGQVTHDHRWDRDKNRNRDYDRNHDRQ